MRILFSAFMSVASMALVPPVEAQSSVSLDAYVFDKSNQKPLANAVVLLRYFTNPNDDTAFTSSTLSDANGLAALLGGQFTEQVRSEIEVICNTRRGLIRQTTPFYQGPPERTVFQRNFYLALPRNIHECIFP